MELQSGLLIALVVITAINLIILIFLLIRSFSSQGPVEIPDFSSEVKALREEITRVLRDQREEVSKGLREGNKAITDGLAQASNNQTTHLESVIRQLKEFSEANRTQSEELRKTVETRLQALQESNEKRLDQMQKVVEEKLQDTLSRRLGESFAQVSKNLEDVQQGLGEMKALATGVGDLKKVLTNVKARGTWGEIQLQVLLEQMLTPEQFARNVHTKEGSREVVEFAVRLPGKDDGNPVWLPIDSKFPQEDYQHLLEASERGDAAAVKTAIEALNRAIKISAQDICEKYLDPPGTTDFGILFLPTEGLYAEVLRQPALVEDLRQNCRVIVAGPTTLAAILNGFQMGFRSLAIEKRSSEVWKVLGAVKTEFSKFGGVLEKLRKQLNTASTTIEKTFTRTRAMEKKLKEVEQLPKGATAKILQLADYEETVSIEEADLKEAEEEEEGEEK
jgi:DNA recombination protein RmuC